ncbi:ABC transporter permease [Patulibacter sp. NPDC049589]|uniref:ABC transporter permease n=1 Tax=Patulibacter sp. NPDC049589 TaxID=3154731 RepID=UPI003423EA8C
MSTIPVLGDERPGAPAAPGAPPPAAGGRPSAGPYLAYAARRLVQAVLVILLAYVITFVVLSVIGNNPIASQLANPQSGLGPDEVKRLESFYGVNKPVLERLWLDLSRFVRGDFGISLQSRLPVSELIRTALPYTLKLAGLALALSLLFAAALAFASQRFPWRWGREAARSVPSFFLSVPNFVIGLILIQVLSFHLHAFNVLEPDAFVGTLCAAIALAVPISAPLSEVLIANLDNESSQEYVLVARSRGLSERKIFLRHLIKPSSLPAVTMAAIITGELMGGALVTEEVFGRTGVGTVMYSAVSTGDTPVLQAVVALAAVVFVVVNLVADLLAPLLDPRVEIVGPKSAPGLVRGLGRGFQAGNRLGTRA